MRLTNLPASQYSPFVGRSRQPRRFIKVDLPEPDGPRIATNSPGYTSSETPRSACTRVFLPTPYVFVRLRTAITGVCSLSLATGLQVFCIGSVLAVLGSSVFIVCGFNIDGA